VTPLSARWFTAPIPGLCSSLQHLVPKARFLRPSFKEPGTGLAVALPMTPHRRAALATALSLLLGPPPAPAGAREAAPAGAPELAPAGTREPAPLRWERSDALPGLGEASAVAFDSETGQLAVGDAQGTWLLEEGRGARRISRRGPVRDLAFGPDRNLWIATDVGLFLRDVDGRVGDRSPAPGPAAREVRRVVPRAGFVLCATAAGAYYAPAGRGWRRLDAGLPTGSVEAMAVREVEGEPAAIDVWLIARGSVVQARMADPADPVEGFRVASVRFVSLPEAARESVDLSTSLPGVDVAVLGRRTLSLLQDDRWHTLRPVFPAGATPSRLARAAGRVWIATDGGLLQQTEGLGPLQLQGLGPTQQPESGRQSEGGFRRASPPMASAAIAALAGDARRVFAAGRRGLWSGGEIVPDPATPSSALPGAPPHDDGPGGSDGEPQVTAVHRAALGYLDLRRGRIERLQRGVRRRGWLPEVELRGAYGAGRASEVDYDQTFTSGERRLFIDREFDRGRDYDLFATLKWDLGDVLYHPEQIDVSKEARELIELRDDVLDEITQLYFERRRALIDAHRTAATTPLEAARLRLRAAELAAGLDAWTGGWWSRQLAELALAELPEPAERTERLPPSPLGP